MKWDQAAQRDKVRERTDPTDMEYWLTIFTDGVRCDQCGNHGGALAGVEVAGYRHLDKHKLCEACLEANGIVARPSRRYLAFKNAGKASSKPRRRRKSRRV